MSRVAIVFFGFVQQETSIDIMIPYDIYMIRHALFVVFWGTLLRPTDCGSCNVDPKIHHPAKHSMAICGHTGGVLRDFVLAFRHLP